MANQDSPLWERLGMDYDLSHPWTSFNMAMALNLGLLTDTIYIKTQVFRLLRYYSPAPRDIDKSDWVTLNITHNMTSSIVQPYGLHSL